MAMTKRPAAADKAKERPGECLSLSIKYLDYRPRSESELRGLLAKKSFSEKEIGEAILHLKEVGLINDLRFARLWKESRLNSKPRSKKMISLELGKKGISQEIVDETINDIDDEEIAYEMALRKARKLSHDAKLESHLYNFLKRHGFSHGLAMKTIKKISTRGIERWE
jgi:regulatory protein